MSQTEIKVEIYRPSEAGYWFRESWEKENFLELKSVGLTLKMADIYNEVFIGE